MKSQKRGRRSNSLRWAAKLLHFLEQINELILIFRWLVQNADYFFEYFVLFLVSLFVLFLNLALIFIEILVIVLFRLL